MKWSYIVDVIEVNWLPTFSTYDQIIFSKASEPFTANPSAENRDTGITTNVDLWLNNCFGTANEKPDEKHVDGEWGEKHYTPAFKQEMDREEKIYFICLTRNIFQHVEEKYIPPLSYKKYKYILTRLFEKLFSEIPL